MAKLNLSFACGYYDLLRPLWEKVVEPAGCELNVMTMQSPERHGRMLRHEEFDVCELSLVGYLIAYDQGRDFTAIPAFPHRRFRHSYMVKRMDCGIETPADLNGKRIGLDTLQNSAGLWMRGILQDYYGLDLRTVEWWCQEPEDVFFEPASWMKMNRVPKGKNIDEMLLNDELEGSLYPEVLPSIRAKSPKVGLLFPDSRAAEAEYFRKSSIFPIMHTVVIKNQILERHPWVAVSMLQALEQAKQVCYERMKDPRSLALVWAKEEVQAQQAIFGADPWPYNLEDNRATLEAAVRYEFEQGMIKKNPQIEDLFFPASIQEIGQYV